MVVLGFENPDFQGEILAELDRLRDNDMIRVIDSLIVYKDADGEVSVLTASNLSEEESAEFGGYVGALIGLGAAGEEGMELGAIVGAEAAEDGVFDGDEVWDVVDEIPENTAAALVLLDHQWAIPLRDAIGRAGGFRIADGFISPLDLVEIGLLAAAEAEALAELEV
jgi:uncharacterized membrane protein